MSGDVQPRKRKDKKRKKDDATEQSFTQPPIISSATVNEDVNIHIHKEEGTGGGICAKIVFFLLFSALAVLVGLIITEHRGLTDLETVEQESRFSQIFEGWIDSSPNHDEQDQSLNDLKDELVEHEEETHDQEEDEHDESEASEEVSELVDNEEEEEEEEGDDEEVTEEIQNDQDEDVDQSEQSEEQLEDSEQNVDSEEAENTSELKDDEQEEEEDDEEQIDEDISRYIEKSAEEENDNEDNSEDTSKNEEEEDDVDKGDPSEDDENLSNQLDDDLDEETLDQEEQQDEEELVADKLSENEEEEEIMDQSVKPETNKTTSYTDMVVKIGVGLALLVVAHVVLIRKWKPASPATVESIEDQVPSDLTRRNTIVVPPSYPEVQHDIEENGEEYSDEDAEIESDDDRVPIKSTQMKYQELRTTYQRSLTPESETENKQTDEEEYEEEVEEEIEEEEEEDDEEEEGSEEDDEDLLKRLEAKYGKLQDQTKDTTRHKDSVDEQFSTWKRVKVSDNNEPIESDSDQQSDVDAYDYENITNKEDSRIRDEIDEAQATIRNNATYAIKLFDMLLQQFPSSPRCLYGKAQALDILAEEQKSNIFLQKSIDLYLKVLDAKDVPDDLFEAAADRCINRLRFIGSYNRAVDVHFKLIERFPTVANHKNQLVITYLTMNRVAKARKVLEDLLLKHPDDGLGLVHYGFILKITDNKLNESVDYLRRGIASKAEGVVDGRFYFHLGDALSRLGRQDEAMQVYEEGVSYNLFLSKYQRSLYNVEHLKGQPWWEKTETKYEALYSALENNWQQIRDEGLAALNKKNTFQDESENLKDTGDWKQLELFARGQKNVDNCKKCPFTCKIIESIPEARTCRRGQTKFSVMHPGTHVWPHCGPTNCRLRAHLGVKVPEHTYIRVARETRSWKEGKVFIFDDSFEHEVWHNGTTFRLVLIVDVWHPELTQQERRRLSPI